MKSRKRDRIRLSYDFNCFFDAGRNNSGEPECVQPQCKCMIYYPAGDRARLFEEVDCKSGFAIGSRKHALTSLRDYFATRPELNAFGSRTNCEVLVVGPRRCLVSCHGYDIDLTQRDMSYTAIPDLREIYHSGQNLNCVVKAFDREAGLLSISVKETVPNPYDGAAFRHPVQSHRQGVIAGKYGGGVFCNLPDGVTVMCSYSFHYDDSAFHSGDRVMLIIQRYDDRKKQIYGKIVAKC